MPKTVIQGRPIAGRAPVGRPNFVAALVLLAATFSYLGSANGSPGSAGPTSQATNVGGTPLRSPAISVGGVPGLSRMTNKVQVAYEPVQKQEAQSTIPEIEMFVGESRVFPAPGVARIAVGSGQVVSASALDDDQVIMFANGVGTSTLFLWHRDGRHQRIKVTVVQGDTTRIAQEVSAFLSKMRNATVSVVGDKVIVEGDELSDADRDKIAELAKRYPQIINFTSPIGWEQMVMMDVKVVEFPKAELRELGLKWSATGGAAVGAVWLPTGRGNQNDYRINTPPGPSGSLPISPISENVPPLPSSLTILSGINLGLTAQLNLLEQSGKASILAEPQLSTRSGYRASFLAGGEFPYSVATVNGVTVQFKPYGIRLDIDPKVGANGVIRAIVDSEVSSIDASVTTTTGPALLTRRTKTEFNVRNGETIVLSGLLQRSMSTDIDKLPMLGDIPVLGALFRSKRFQNKETELVVFVTPTIVDSRSAGLVDRIERTTERLGTQLGGSPYLSEPLQPGSKAADFNAAPPRALKTPLQQ
jgi:pilus assembly protein CpaC